jgi:hypothetical protein
MGGGSKERLEGLSVSREFLLIGLYGNQQSMCRNLSLLVSCLLFSLSSFWFPYVSVGIHI